MNDIWYLGEGFWVVYTEDMQAAMDFASIPDIKHVTTYYTPLGKRKALQFKFFQGEELKPGRCLLHYVCRTLGFDFSRVLKLTGLEPGVPYREVYGRCSYQPELFQLYEEYIPERKGRRKKIKKGV